MCDCDKKEIDPKPGEVWDLAGYNGRFIVLCIRGASYPYHGLFLATGDYDLFAKSAFIKLSEDQSHDAILPNAAPQPLKLEVGKVYELRNRERALCVDWLHNEGAGNPMILVKLEGKGIGYRNYYKLNGVFSSDSADHYLDAIKLSPNQSREIIL